jgi:hypothetical protein
MAATVGASCQENQLNGFCKCESESSQHLLKHRGVAVATDYVLTPPCSVARQMAVTQHERSTDKTGESRLG